MTLELSYLAGNQLAFHFRNNTMDSPKSKRSFEVVIVGAGTQGT
jgi:hypothetical protein